MEILHNGQRRKPFLSQYKMNSFSVFVQTTSRLCVCFVADLILMERTGHVLRYLPGNCTRPTILIFILCDTIPCYAMLYYTLPYFTILCYVLYSYKILCYNHTILYSYSCSLAAGETANV